MAASTPNDRSGAALTGTPTLSRIPGMGDEGQSAPVVIGDHEMTAAEAVALLTSGDTGPRVPLAIKALSEAQLSRHDTTLFASALLSLERTGAPSGDAAALALVTLVSTPSASLEGLFLGMQLLRAWEPAPERAALRSSVAGALAAAIAELKFANGMTRRQLAEVRYVLLRAFESAALQEPAAAAIRTVLTDQSPRLMPERKELAGAVLSASSALRGPSGEIPGLKRLAASVFATGVAPVSMRETPEGCQRRRVSFLVTAQDAERRRQFGLASAIELHKAATLLDRPLTLAEHEVALAFHNDASAPVPGNQSWLTRDEWRTAHRLITLALEERSLAPLDALALLHLLATQVKVEDPSDSRVSFRRPDLLDASTRLNTVRETALLAAQHGLALEDVTARANEAAARLFDRAFLVRNPSSVTLDDAPTAGADGSGSAKANTAINLSTSDLVSRLVRDNSPAFVSRLVAADFETLKRAQGLDADQFRVVLERIRHRAISDPWARIAFLEILRAPHDAAVTPSARTAALGALVSEARRLGRLTPTLEKEVFAASAEIPQLEAAAEGTSDSEKGRESAA